MSPRSSQAKHHRSTEQTSPCVSWRVAKSPDVSGITARGRGLQTIVDNRDYSYNAAVMTLQDSVSDFYGVNVTMLWLCYVMDMLSIYKLKHISSFFYIRAGQSFLHLSKSSTKNTLYLFIHELNWLAVVHDKTTFVCVCVVPGHAACSVMWLTRRVLLTCLWVEPENKR